MRILHLMLSCFYIEGYNYQENYLPYLHKKMGNDVKIIASTEVLKKNNEYDYVDPTEFVNEHGIEVSRIAYSKIISNTLSRKFRKYENLENKILDYKPDIVFYHGLGGYALFQVYKCKNEYHDFVFFVDSHEDHNNSGTNFLSKILLHKMFNRQIVQMCDPKIDRYYYISTESMVFINEMYKVPFDKMTFLPLGGNVIHPNIVAIKRKEMRKKLQIDDSNIIFVHSGKIDANKKIVEFSRAFSSIKDANFKFIIVGDFANEVKDDIKQLINDDNRIIYLGWKSPEELTDLLCGCDIYAQPGSQSATLQNAACIGLALMMYPHQSYLDIFQPNEVFYVKNSEEIKNTINNISSNHSMVLEKAKISHTVSLNKLNYTNHSKKIIQDALEIKTKRSHYE